MMKLTLSQIQLCVQQIKGMHKDVGYPICAGGAPRDVFLKQVEPKDLDIFYQSAIFYDNEPNEVSFAEMAEEIEWVVDLINKLLHVKGSYCGKPRGKGIQNEDEEGKYGDSTRIYAVWHWPKAFYDMPMDLVFCNTDPLEQVKAFDFGICQAYVGASYGFKSLPAFSKDYANKTITYLRQGDPEELRIKQKEHLLRILQKYPHWKPMGTQL